ncbi:hypothetical protein [Flavobacterium sp.]|uniref:hypothetical protein n=1 Tax=Flavobacterium sp. TaxID=239 RepID=UPI0037526BA6
MKVYKPPKRLKELGLVLQYDSERQEIGLNPILEIEQRILINQERARIMSGDDSYTQPTNYEATIQAVLLEIVKQNWNPKSEIKYGQSAN